ncbi:hypothetical protein [Pseudomonas laurylsulfatiphila]|uniref:hypothetical protein n=1 Tax=Pseudomonas laurylsulfatiphila TaxID=2011015 RepID=UPI003D23FF70|nr:hypothetical protein [Pseudomonas reinekei]
MNNVVRKNPAQGSQGGIFDYSRITGKDVVDLHKDEKELAIALTGLDASFLVTATRIDMHFQNAEASYAIVRNA